MTESVLPTLHPHDYLTLGPSVTCSVSLLCTCQGTQHLGHASSNHTCSPPTLPSGEPSTPCSLASCWPEVHGGPLSSFLDHTDWWGLNIPTTIMRKFLSANHSHTESPPLPHPPAQGSPSPGVCPSQWICGPGDNTVQTQCSQLRREMANLRRGR